MPPEQPSPQIPGQSDIQVFFNPQCSKCRTVRSILEEKGLEADYMRYLERAPTREQLEDVLTMLGTSDPRKMMRRGEKVYRELDLASADRETLL
ncbi:MAG: hypothetical protein ACRDLB_07755, partial [Actinomycetota bacterium]